MVFIVETGTGRGTWGYFGGSRSFEACVGVSQNFGTNKSKQIDVSELEGLHQYFFFLKKGAEYVVPEGNGVWTVRKSHPIGFCLKVQL